MSVLEVKHLCKNLKGFRLQDVSFELEPGYITGFIGQNGAGKTTTIKLILQLMKPDSGEIRLFGMDPDKDGREIKERIGFVFDESPFYDHLTVEEMKKVIAPFYKRWNENLFRRNVGDFGLPLKKKIKHLSKGMKMKLSLAIALAHEADLIIMDEPTAGLDPVFRREILDLLAEIIQDGEKTVFFSTHITTDLEQIADYIIFIHQGRIVFHQSKEEIMDSYAIVRGDKKWLNPENRKDFIGLRETSLGFEGLFRDRIKAEQIFGGKALVERPKLEEIMYFTIKGEGNHGLV